jgi:hypothetical protein
MKVTQILKMLSPVARVGNNLHKNKSSLPSPYADSEQVLKVLHALPLVLMQ